jgi:hypothetical protein
MRRLVSFSHLTISAESASDVTVSLRALGCVASQVRTSGSSKSLSNCSTLPSCGGTSSAETSPISPNSMHTNKTTRISIIHSGKHQTSALGKFLRWVYLSHYREPRSMLPILTVILGTVEFFEALIQKIQECFCTMRGQYIGNQDGRLLYRRVVPYERRAGNGGNSWARKDVAALHNFTRNANLRLARIIAVGTFGSEGI